VHPDHRLLFDAALLEQQLAEAGFTDIADVSGQDPDCHHTRDWREWVPGLCLEVSALA
jgi:hypothetical protein